MLAHPGDFIKVDIHHQQAGLCAGAGDGCAPGGADDGIGIGNIAAGSIPRRRNAQGEQLIIHGPHSETQFPMQGTGGHIEGCRDDDRLGTLQRHGAKQLRETDVEANTKADADAIHGEDRRLAAGGENGGFPEMLATVDVGVKQVDLSVPGDLTAVFVENKAGIIEVVAAALRNGSCYQSQSVLFGGLRKRGTEHTACFLRKNREGRIGIRAAEHFRQDRHTGAGCGSAGDIFPGGLQVFLFVFGDGHLNQCKFHKHNSLSLFAVMIIVFMATVNRSVVEGLLRGYLEDNGIDFIYGKSTKNIDFI